MKVCELTFPIIKYFVLSPLSIYNTNCGGQTVTLYSKTCLKRNLKGPERFSAKARFPFNQGTLHIKIKPGHAPIRDKIKHHTR